MGKGTSVSTGDRILAAKMNLKLENLADEVLSDDEKVYFGTGSDGEVYFDGSHLRINTPTFGNIRLNHQDYTATSGDITAVQSKPNVSVGGTTGLTALEVSPRFAEGIAGSKLVGIMSNPDLKGAAGGNLSSAVRAYEGKIESASGSTRTVAEAYVLHCMQALHGTVTVGPYPICVDAGGGNVAWAGLFLLPDDEQIASKDDGATPKLVDISGTANDGWIKLKAGDEVKYIALYNEKTS